MERRFALNASGQPRKRGFARKVKTGCVSCKQARVRCSEGKPTCKRCAKRNFNCVYQLPVTWVFQSAQKNVDKELTRLHSNHIPDVTPDQGSVNEACNNFQLSPYSFNTAITAACTPSTQRYQTSDSVAASVQPTASCRLGLDGSSLELEPASCPPLLGGIPFYSNSSHAAALQYFLEVPGRRIAYNKASHFFRVILPQAVWMHPAVVESMTALATLGASLSGSSTAAWTIKGPLYHHGKAVATVHRLKPARHITLLVCMLLWLYEQFGNQHTRALFHRQSAVKLLTEWQTQERGSDNIIDDYIAENLEPTLMTGLKITAPVKLCREVLGDLQSLVDDSTDVCGQCTYVQAVDSLGACIGSFVIRGAEEASQPSLFLLQTSSTSLRMWDYQFEHYSGDNWAVDGSTLLLYATTVALLIQRTGLVKSRWDDDWQRAVEFLLEETAKLDSGPEDEITHHWLLQGVAMIASGEDGKGC